MKAYQKRMIKEYKELKNRTNALGFVIVKEARGELDFELTCPVELLKAQYNAMNAYLNILEMRAGIEGIELECEVEK